MRLLNPLKLSASKTKNKVKNGPVPIDEPDNRIPRKATRQAKAPPSKILYKNLELFMDLYKRRSHFKSTEFIEMSEDEAKLFDLSVIHDLSVICDLPSCL